MDWLAYSTPIETVDAASSTFILVFGISKRTRSGESQSGHGRSLANRRFGCVNADPRGNSSRRHGFRAWKENRTFLDDGAWSRERVLLDLVGCALSRGPNVEDRQQSGVVESRRDTWRALGGFASSSECDLWSGEGTMRDDLVPGGCIWRGLGGNLSVESASHQLVPKLMFVLTRSFTYSPARRFPSRATGRISGTVSSSSKGLNLIVGVVVLVSGDLVGIGRGLRVDSGSRSKIGLCCGRRALVERDVLG